jgi:hypothetical protein
VALAILTVSLPMAGGHALKPEVDGLKPYRASMCPNATHCHGTQPAFGKKTLVSSTSFREIDVMKFPCDVTGRIGGLISFG